jgi:predicted esterase
MTFDELSHEMFRLYGERRYAEGLALLMRESDRFPEHRSRTLFWRSCFAAVMGDPEGAIGWLQQGVDAGEWYSPEQLRRDPDLATLQGRADFERIVEYCQVRLAEAEKDVVPDRRVFVPPGSAPPYPLLMALHGFFTTQVEFERVHLEAWKASVEMGWLLAAPRASQRLGPEAYGWRDPARAAQEICDFFVEVKAQHLLDEGRIALGGFSAGAGLALDLALRARIPACGIIAASPSGALIRDLTAWLAAGEARRVPVYFIVGELDQSCLLAVHKLVEALNSLGIANRVEQHPGLGHDLPPDFCHSLRAALAFISPG